jgi:diadenosine tetraphosphatase ApaH/serine/threonine PP2A family protein phosphatase
MKIALVSDIHSNLEAFDAVLIDISRKGVSRIGFLGDIVGYGPDPKECLSLSRIFDFMILGNHDDAILYNSTETFNARAKSAIDWTQGILFKDMDFVNHIKKNFITHKIENGVLFCHGSPRDYTREYVFPDLSTNPEHVREIFDALDWVAFVGHTHHPGIMLPDGEYYYPEELDFYFRLGRKKAIVNVGSVGQPRDGNPRACYCIFDDSTKVVEWYRIEYNVAKTAKKIVDTGILDPFLAKRLEVGK